MYLAVFKENQEVDALHKLKQKLKSQTGASITFALLLFLVCAVVGSAVLVAGTAAAGRMSKVAEMDQRYFAVNSAARLLMEQVTGDKNTVTVIKMTDLSDNTDSYTLLDAKGNEIKIGTTAPTLNICQEVALWLTNNPSEPRTGDNKVSLSLTATASRESTADLEKLNVDIEETIKIPEYAEDARVLVFLIKSKEDTAKKDGQYSLELQFNLTKSEVVDETEKQLTTIYKYTWNIQDLRVVGSQRWSDAT